LIITVLPREDEKEPFLALDRSVETIENTSHINSKQFGLIRSGVENALLHGPKVGCPVNDFNN